MKTITKQEAWNILDRCEGVMLEDGDEGVFAYVGQLNGRPEDDDDEFCTFYCDDVDGMESKDGGYILKLGEIKKVIVDRYNLIIVYKKESVSYEETLTMQPMFAQRLEDV